MPLRWFSVIAQALIAWCRRARQLWATGGYDHVVKLWDMRAAMAGGADGAAAGADVISTSSGSSCLMSFNHGAPVEEVLMLPGGGAVVSAGM